MATAGGLLGAGPRFGSARVVEYEHVGRYRKGFADRFGRKAVDERLSDRVDSLLLAAAKDGRRELLQPLIVGNASAFWGDRPSAPRELVRGGPIHVLTADYLAAHAPAEMRWALVGRNRATRREGQG